MATAPIAATMAEVQARFPGLRYEVSACRKIAGSARWSQHAHDNAVDIFGPTATLDAVYSYLSANRARLGLGAICWKHHGPCNAAAHQDHIHAEGPRIDAVPACAGGPGGTPGSAATPSIADAARAAADGNQLVQGAQLLAFLVQPENWLRIAMGGAGVAAIGAGVLLIVKDTTGLDPQAVAGLIGAKLPAARAAEVAS